jgi:dihydropteroate synthase
MEVCRKKGITDIIVDPGFGFGKSMDENYFLLKNLEAFKILDKPILVGISRKSMIYNKLGCNVDEALNGTTILNTLALSKGANILRVHDVKEAVECRTLLDAVG